MPSAPMPSAPMPSECRRGFRRHFYAGGTMSRITARSGIGTANP
ncbi:hypothetical protein [Neisseria meningitidis]|nr:hypothetical protein [Neisseria meningitidis]